jgi:hypothetical protein
VGVVDWGGESSFAADELRRTSGVSDGSVVCETLLNCAVKGSRKVGGRRRESRQHARLAARERNMLCVVWLSVQWIIALQSTLRRIDRICQGRDKP